MPLLQARQVARGKCAALDHRLIRSVQGDATCRMLMTMPGIGPITAVAYLAALEKPDTFKRSRAVGAWLGLTPRRFQSGEVDYDGHISRRGDGQLRALLYEAAAVLMTRVRRESALRSWGLVLCQFFTLSTDPPLPDRKSTISLFPSIEAEAGGCRRGFF